MSCRIAPNRALAHGNAHHKYGGQDRAAALADYDKAMAALKKPAAGDTSKK